MTHKKNSLFTLIFSVIPGAGQMYLGLLKRGASIMTLFLGLCALAQWFSISEFVFILPVIWFFSFFDTHRLKNMSDEKFYAIEDKFILIDSGDPSVINFMKKRKKFIAIALILFGAFILWKNFNNLISSFLPYNVVNAIYDISNRLPQVAMAVAIIAFGIFLISGKKNELDESNRKLNDIDNKFDFEDNE